MGNIVAQLALLTWLPLSLWIASMLPPIRAALVILIGGALFLPERVAYDFPVVPPLDKHSIATLSAFVACALNKPKSVLGPQNTGATRWVLFFILINIVGTVATNPDALRFGPIGIPGLTAYDAIASVVNWGLRVALPFYLGQTLFRTCDDLREFLRALVLAALVYVPFILLEARLSPVFHEKIYGFFQHDFIQAIRAGGFRAFVFMSHGLAVAFFVSQSLTAVAGLSRVRDSALPMTTRMITIVLTVALITCKSMGAFIYAGLSVPLIWFTKAKTQLKLASWLGTVVLFYPIARLLDWISTEWFLEKAKAFSEDRAASLEFRFINEGMLLERAQERPWFGWGGWGRNHVFDPIDGKDLTVADGEWIIQFGAGGALGFVIVFGMLLWPVFRARKVANKKKLDPDDEQILATFGLLLAFTGLDLIPNAISHPLPYVLAGALMSVSTGLLLKKAGASAVRPSAPAQARAVRAGAPRVDGRSAARDA